MMKQAMRVSQFASVFWIKGGKDELGKDYLDGDLHFNIKKKDSDGFVLVHSSELSGFTNSFKPILEKRTLFQVWDYLGSPFSIDTFKDWCIECLSALSVQSYEWKQVKIFGFFMLMFAAYLKENNVPQEQWFEIMKPRISYDLELASKYVRFTEDN